VLATSLALFASVGVCVGSPPAKSLPRFEEFQVRLDFEGPVHPVDLASHPKARQFRTRLREGAIAPADFAGHYRVISWGCGTGCQVNAFVDLASGRVYFGPYSLLGTETRADSALLIVNPPERIPRDADGRQPDGHHIHSYYYRLNESTHRLESTYTDDPSGFPSPEPDAEGPQYERARAAVLAYVISTLHDWQSCLAVRPLVLPSAPALSATDVDSVLAEFRGNTEDPSGAVMSALSAERVVPMSRCPEPSQPRHVFHVVAGPVRALEAGHVQVAISSNMDGFPEIQLCEAASQDGRWHVQRCVLVLQS
jgi:hypothetical protein